MEQIRFFLAEYANEIAAAAWVVTLILLLTTLHKIRRIGRQVRKLAEAAVQAQSQAKAKDQEMEAALQMQSRAKDEDRKAEIVPEPDKPTEQDGTGGREKSAASESAGDTDAVTTAVEAAEKPAASESAGDADTVTKAAEAVEKPGTAVGADEVRENGPQALLDAVLGEVFP